MTAQMTDGPNSLANVMFDWMFMKRVEGVRVYEGFCVSVCLKRDCSNFSVSELLGQIDLI